MKKYDKVILGAGFYGLYAALYCARKGQEILILEKDGQPLARASSNNQARVHMGYHYPRSLSTAMKSRGYFDRFIEDFGFSINRNFEQIYATSRSFSWTSAEQFKRFCINADIPCEEVPSARYFKDGMCDGAFSTTEFAYDPTLLKEHLMREAKINPGITVQFSSCIQSIENDGKNFLLHLADGEKIQTDFILNATYAGINQIHRMLGLEPVKIKYELCEIALCRVNELLVDKGITVMDGPFFSIMPYGNSGLHSLTTVTFTPHATCYGLLPEFTCQNRSEGYCSEMDLGNCNICSVKPQTEWFYMSNLAKKYLKDDYQFEYVRSLFAIKPILMTSEIDDSRPTVIKEVSTNPTFISVLSGKINTVYDVEEVLTI